MSITAIWGPPQSGKTSLAVELAYALSRYGDSTCIISPEPYSELSGLLNIRITQPKSLAQALLTPGNLKQIVFEVDELYYALAMPWDADAFDEVSGSVARELLTQANETFDTVIVDCPSDAGNAIAARAISMAESVIMLSGGSAASAMWYSAFRRSTPAVMTRSICVCDQVRASYDYAELCTLIGQEPKIFIPHYPETASAHASKKFVYGNGGKIGKAFTQNVDMLIDCMEALEVNKE